MSQDGNSNTQTYRWVEDSIVNTKNLRKDGIVDYSKLEITVGDQKDVIELYDSVLLSSDDIEIDEKLDPSKKKLDTFVARVEKMWEEPASDDCSDEKEGDMMSEDKEEYNQERKTRMKIRARWYFKKKDMQEIGGNFVGQNRRNFLDAMTPQSLVLGTHSDDNEVTTILSKCQVINRAATADISTSPKSEATDNGNATIGDKDPHVYVCNYMVHIPKQGEKGYGDVIISSIDESKTNVPLDTPTSSTENTKSPPTSPSHSNAKETNIKEARKSRKRSAEEIESNDTASGDKEQVDGTNVSKDVEQKQNADQESKKRKSSNPDTEIDSNESQNKGDIGTMEKKSLDSSEELKTNIEDTSMDVDTAESDKKESEKDASDNASAPKTEVNDEKNNEEDGSQTDKDKNSVVNTNASSTSDNDVDDDDDEDDEDDDDDEDESSSSQKDTTSASNLETNNPKITKEGVIHIGPNHQAVIPPLPNHPDSQKNLPSKVKEEKSGNSPIPVWTPGKITSNDMDQYILDSGIILKDFMKQNDIEVIEVPASSMLMDSLGEGLMKFPLRQPNETARTTNKTNSNATSEDVPKPIERKSRTIIRECKEDKIIEELHNSSYDTQAALEKIRSDPFAYLTIWDKNEKDSFNNGFRRYRGSLRSISKGVPSKTYKDVIDYHYRFKIPYQFRKYQEKKTEQAKKMMDAMMQRERDDESSGAHKKSRHWTKVGASGQRKAAAKEFLIQVKDTIGSENYLLLASELKSYHEKNQSVAILKENITPLLHPHIALLERFLEFLPKKYRT